MRPIVAMLIWPALALAAATAAEAPVWRAAEPGYAWSFPRDLAAHPDYKTEWWYVTGHLAPAGSGAAAPADELAFQLTFFRVGLSPEPPAGGLSEWAARDLVMAHAALLDPRHGGNVFSEVIRRAAPFLGGFGAPGESRLAWVRAPAGTDADWSVEWSDGAWRLRARDDGRIP